MFNGIIGRPFPFPIALFFRSCPHSPVNPLPCCSQYGTTNLRHSVASFVSGSKRFAEINNWVLFTVADDTNRPLVTKQDHSLLKMHCRCLWVIVGIRRRKAEISMKESSIWWLISDSDRQAVSNFKTRRRRRWHRWPIGKKRRMTQLPQRIQWKEFFALDNVLIGVTAANG